MKNQVFNSFWHGPELSPLHWACLKSFVDHGHRMRVFSFHPLVLPQGVVQEDARRLVPQSELFAFDGSYAAFSNIVRYKLLLDDGGWWVDTDVYCQSDDIPECTYAWAHEDAGKINSALMRFPAGDATLRAIYDEARATGSNVKTWGEIGPLLLTRHLAGRKFEGHYGTTTDFYPLHWSETHLLWMPGGAEAVRQRCAQSPFIHLWAAMFRQYGIDIYKPAPDGSFLRWIAARSGHPAGAVPANAAIQAHAMDGVAALLAHPKFQEHLRKATALAGLGTP